MKNGGGTEKIKMIVIFENC